MEVLAPFFAIIVIAIIEYLAARVWLAAYFRFGIPLIRIRLQGVRIDHTTESRLDGIAEKNSSSVVYQRLSEGEIAFREKGKAAPTFRYVPIVRGLLRYVPEEGATYVIGWLNFFAIACVALMAYIFFDAPSFRKPWDLLAMFVLVFGGMVLIGVLRYRGIAKALRSELIPAQTAQPSSPNR